MESTWEHQGKAAWTMPKPQHLLGLGFEGFGVGRVCWSLYRAGSSVNTYTSCHTCLLLPSPHTPRRAMPRQAGHPTQPLRRRNLKNPEQQAQLQQQQGGNHQQGSPCSRSWGAWLHGLSRVQSRAAGWSCCGTAAPTHTGSECLTSGWAVQWSGCGEATVTTPVHAAAGPTASSRTSSTCSSTGGWPCRWGHLHAQSVSQPVSLSQAAGDSSLPPPPCLASSPPPVCTGLGISCSSSSRSSHAARSSSMIAAGVCVSHTGSAPVCRLQVRRELHTQQAVDQGGQRPPRPQGAGVKTTGHWAGAGSTHNTARMKPEQQWRD